RRELLLEGDVPGPDASRRAVVAGALLAHGRVFVPRRGGDLALEQVHDRAVEDVLGHALDVAEVVLGASAVASVVLRVVRGRVAVDEDRVRLDVRGGAFRSVAAARGVGRVAERGRQDVDRIAGDERQGAVGRVGRV